MAKSKKRASDVFITANKDPRFSSLCESQQLGKNRKEENEGKGKDPVDARFADHLMHLERDFQANISEATSTNNAIPYAAVPSTFDRTSLLQTQEDQIPFTKKLALVDFALWDCVVAADLHVLFSSFTPAEGKLLSVTIYVSDLGKKHSHGGALPDLWKGSDPLHVKGDLDEKKVKYYRCLRRRFYYAVLLFDSEETAAEVHYRCDGIEIEYTKYPITLEVVPTGTSFDKSSIHDESVEYPSLYVLPPVLQTLSSRVKSTINKKNNDEPSSHHSSQDYEKYEEGQVLEIGASASSSDECADDLTGLWDITDPKRTAALTSAFAIEDMKMDDLEAYIASDSEDSPERKRLRGRYAGLLENLSEEARESDSMPPSEAANSEMEEFTTEFSVSDENAREELHRKILLENSLHNAKSVGAKIEIKRRLKKKERKVKLEEQRAMKSLPMDTLEIRDDLVRVNPKERSMSRDEKEASQMPMAPVEVDGPGQQALSAKERRKIHKKNKQLTSSLHRAERKSRRLRHAHGLSFVDSSVKTLDSTLSPNKTVVEDERFAERINSEQEFHVDSAISRAKNVS